MKTISLDILEKSALPSPQAHAILTVLEQEMASSQENLATKADLAESQLATKVDLANLRAEMLERFGRIDARFGELIGKIDGRLGAMQGNMEAGFGKQEGRLTRWVFTCILGQTAVLAGFGYFLFAHFQK